MMRGLKILNISEKKAIIDIDGDIGFDWWKEGDDPQNTKERIKNELKSIADIKATEIDVFINSYGGDVNHGVSIHDLLAAHPAKITTIVNGLTASAATIIAQAGDTRKMSDNALYLVHNASTGAWGNKNQMQSVLNDLDIVDNRIANIYAKRSGKSVDSFIDLMNESNGEGVWLTAKEAKEHGLIDEVFEPFQAVASYRAQAKEYGLPTMPTKSKSQNKNNMDFETLNKKIDELQNTVKNWVKGQGKEVKITDNAEIKNLIDTFKHDLQHAKDLNEDLSNQLYTKIDEFEDLKEKFDAQAVDLAKAQGKPTPDGGGADPDPDGKTELSANDKAAEENAKALRIG